MKKTFWILLFLVLIAANLLVYMISLNDAPNEVEEGYTEGNISGLMNIYYFIFAGMIIVAIAFIIITLIRQSMQVYY